VNGIFKAFDCRSISVTDVSLKHFSCFVDLCQMELDFVAVFVSFVPFRSFDQTTEIESKLVLRTHVANEEIWYM